MWKFVFLMFILLTSQLRARNLHRLEQDSRFGVDYVFPFQERFQSKFWPRQMAATKAGWVNFHLVSWIDIEPNPPKKGVHYYHWEKLDNCVRLWQEQGFYIVLTLRLKKGWFSGPIKYAPDMTGLVGRLHYRYSDRLPLAKYRKDLQAWMAALVERYDGDGRDDMPRLKSPIYHYQIGNEYANPMFWTGTIEDYGLYLKLMTRAAKGACPKCKIIANGIRWNDAFEGDDEAKEFDTRFQSMLKGLPNDQWRRAWQRVRTMTEYTVAQAHTYDILDGGGNGPYWRGSQGYMAWMKKELSKNDLHTTIWDLEARCEPQIAVPPKTNILENNLVPQGKKILTALKWSFHPLHQRASNWYRQEQARLVAKVFVTRFAAGFEKVFMGMPDDWDATAASWLFPNPYLGFMTGQGKKWPAYYTLALLIDKVDGFSKAHRVDAPKEIALYRFDFPPPRKAVWVVWLETLQRRGMSQQLPAKKVTLKQLQGKFRRISILQNSLIFEEKAVGKEAKPLTIEVDPTPVIFFE